MLTVLDSMATPSPDWKVPSEHAISATIESVAASAKAAVVLCYLWRQCQSSRAEEEFISY